MSKKQATPETVPADDLRKYMLFQAHAAWNYEEGHLYFEAFKHYIMALALAEVLELAEPAREYAQSGTRMWAALEAQ